MKTVLVIGMGRFGRHLSRRLAEMGNEVMIVDRDEEKIRDLLPEVTGAEIADCTNEQALKSLGVRDFDVCFVCTGSDFQSSLEITSLLKDLGAKYVISKASRDVHAKFLLRNGADEIVYPERDIADKLAIRCSVDNVFDLVQLSDDVAIYETPVLPAWVGKTTRELSVRTVYKVNILAVKNNGILNAMLDADYAFKPSDHVLMIGRRRDVDKLMRQL